MNRPFPEISTSSQLYRLMMTIRLAELRVCDIYPSDKVQSPVHLSLGQEAVATLETLETMQPGQLLEVVTDCSQSVHGIPEDAKAKGYNCLAVEQHGPLFRFLIEVPR